MKLLTKNQKNKEFNFKGIVRFYDDEQVVKIETYQLKAFSYINAKTQLIKLCEDNCVANEFSKYEIATLKSGKVF